MECAAVDGRGGAVYPHGALYAPLRTPDGELRRPQEKNHHAVQPKGVIVDDTTRNPRNSGSY